MKWAIQLYIASLIRSKQLRSKRQLEGKSFPTAHGTSSLRSISEVVPRPDGPTNGSSLTDPRLSAQDFILSQFYF